MYFVSLLVVLYRVEPIGYNRGDVHETFSDHLASVDPAICHGRYVHDDICLLPYLDHRLPIVWAILIAYLLLAYGLLPFASRLWRVVFKPNHIPRYVTTPDGWPADPVNIAIVANNKRQLIVAMSKAGWYQADRSNLTNTLHEAYAIVFNKTI